MKHLDLGDPQSTYSSKEKKKKNGERNPILERYHRMEKLTSSNVLIMIV